MNLHSLRKNRDILFEAFRGTAKARTLHAAHRAEPMRVGSGIEIIARRWPALAASELAPIFVLGAGWRTGSTFLQRLITSDDLMIWGEPYGHCSIIDTLSSQLKAFNQRWPHDEFFVSQYPASDLHNVWVANLYPEIQQLLDAHIAFFQALYARPAAELGRPQWGLKDVLLTTDHALYLRWLYPQARFIFLYRNPYDAWRSYRKWRTWYRRWPDRPVHTPTAFGRNWRDLTRDFLDNHEKVGGLLLRYEALQETATRDRLARFLQRPVHSPASLDRVSGVPNDVRLASGYIPKLEKKLLSRQVHRLAAELGYSTG